jgi:Flp pilus assembly protein TadG
VRLFVDVYKLGEGVMMMQSVRQKNGEAGSALVEFALATIVMLVVLFGIIDMGRAAFAYDWVSNTARTATRYAMVRGTSCSTLLSGCNVGPPQGGYETDVRAYVNSQAIGIDTSKVTVTANCEPCTEPSCPLPCAPSNQVVVHVKYVFSFVSPLVPLTWDMNSESAMTVS